MVIDKKENIITVSQENVDLSTFIAHLNKTYPEIRENQLIINLLSFSKLSSIDILEFLELSKTHKEANKSFVLVSNKVSYDEVPEELCVVPTIQEARDIIDMEEIERDLGL